MLAWAEAPRLSVALQVTVQVPMVVDVPLTVPVAALKLRPGGKPLAR